MGLGATGGAAAIATGGGASRGSGGGGGSATDVGTITGVSTGGSDVATMRTSSAGGRGTVTGALPISPESASNSSAWSRSDAASAPVNETRDVFAGRHDLAAR